MQPVRSAYLQRRTSDIFDGNPPDDDEDAPVTDAPLAPGATPQPSPAQAVRPYIALSTLALLAACDRPAAVAPDSREAAMAAAERKAVTDTDAALAATRGVANPGNKSQ